MRTAKVAWGLFAAGTVMVTAIVVLTVLNDFVRVSDWGTGLNGILGGGTSLVFAFAGAMILTRQAENRVGWICLAVGLGIASAEVQGQYVFYALKTDPGGLPGGELVASLNNWDFIWFDALTIVGLALVFPSGGLSGRADRIVAWATAAAVILLSASSALKPGPLPTIDGVRNSLGVDGAGKAMGVVSAVGTVVFGLSIVAAVTSMVRRFRRSTGIERQQLKWFVYALALGAAFFMPVTLVSGGATPLTSDIVTVLFAGVPAAVGVAVLRYRLYDIDVVIRRTLIYAALTGALVVTYLGTVLLAQLVLPERSDLAIAVSTLAAAAVFSPARTRIQAAVDRRFFRRRYDEQRTLEAFGVRLRDTVSLPAIDAELRSVVTETMQPDHVSVWLR